MNYKIFLPRANQSRSNLFAVVDHGPGEVLEQIASFDTMDQATAAADALNATLLLHSEAKRQLDAVIETVPKAVSATLARISQEITDSEDLDDHWLDGTMRQLLAGLRAFPAPTTPSCSACAEDLGDEPNDGIRCLACDNDCEECLEISGTPTPRTALVMRHFALYLADTLSEAVGYNDLDLFAPALPAIWQQEPRFYERFGRCLLSIAEALGEGRFPNPTCVAEELALLTVVEFSRDLEQDGQGPEEADMAQLPKSIFDFQWSELYLPEFDDLTIVLRELDRPMSPDWAKQAFEPFHQARTAA